MSTDNTGIQTRAMAQRVENESHGPPNQDTNPTVEWHKTKDESIKEFVRRNRTIALYWYVPDFSNTRVGDIIEQRLPLETTEDKILFSCPALSEFFKTSNLHLTRHLPQDGTGIHIPRSTRKHRSHMSERPIRSRTPKENTTRQTRHQYCTRGEARKNLKHKETSRTSRRYGLRRGRTQNNSVLPTLDPVRR